MNFLAHLLLSGDSEKIAVGNFMGDFVKGRDMSRFEPLIAKGITLHRMIDNYTDTHPVVRQSKARLHEKYRHYSGVIVDVFYDHFLAVEWPRFNALPLSQFAQNAYNTLQKNENILPEKARRMLPYMQNGNWLVSYASIEGIDSALKGMARRTRFESNMESASEALRNHFDDFKSEFNSFFPMLQHQASLFLAQSD